MVTWLPRAPYEGMGRFAVTGLSYKGQEIELNARPGADLYLDGAHAGAPSSTSYRWTRTSTRS